jgi:quercetin dioxygenase-like cupin family protein
VEETSLVLPDPSGSAPLSRRAVVGGLGAGGLAALLLTAGLERPTAAQDATPTPAYAPGVHAEVPARWEAAAAPGHYLQLDRLTFDPGSKTPPHTHPGDTAAIGFSGTSYVTLLSGSALFVRAGTATPVAGPAGEAMAIGQRYDFRPGDAVMFDAQAVHLAGNDSGAPAVSLEAALRKIGEPLTILAATPAATPES